MTDPLSARLEQASLSIATDLMALNMLDVSVIDAAAVIQKILTPILRDEVAAAEEAVVEELGCQCDPSVGWTCGYHNERRPGTGALARALAAERERTLSEVAGHVMHGYGAACSCGWLDKSRTCVGMTDTRQWQDHIRTLKTQPGELNPRTFTETADHFEKSSRPANCPQDETDVD